MKGELARASGGMNEEDAALLERKPEEPAARHAEACQVENGGLEGAAASEGEHQECKREERDQQQRDAQDRGDGGPLRGRGINELQPAHLGSWDEMDPPWSIHLGQPLGADSHRCELGVGRLGLRRVGSHASFNPIGTSAFQGTEA